MTGHVVNNVLEIICKAIVVVQFDIALFKQKLKKNYENIVEFEVLTDVVANVAKNKLNSVA
jgi:hypothetical protein